jgi:hypothetical protein
LIVMLLAIAAALPAQDALVVSADANRVARSDGGAIAIAWVHATDRGSVAAGATTNGSGDTRWTYGTAGIVRRLTLATMVNAEVNLGRGHDQAGHFSYLVTRAGITHEIAPRRLFAEAEWLHTDAARTRDDILRAGATWQALRNLTVRPALFRSIANGDTALASIRADFDATRATWIAGAAGGRANPAVVNHPAVHGDYREVYAGAGFDAAAVRWTVLGSIISVSDGHGARLSVSCRIPLR